MAANADHPYFGCRAVLSSMHGKEAALAAPFMTEPGIELVAAPGIDTDQLADSSQRSDQIPRGFGKLSACRQWRSKVWPTPRGSRPPMEAMRQYKDAHRSHRGEAVRPLSAKRRYKFGATLKHDCKVPAPMASTPTII